MKTKAEIIKWETNTIKNKKPKLGSLKTKRLSSETKKREKAEISGMRKKIIIKPRNSKKVIIKHLKDLHQKLENTDFGKPKLPQGEKKKLNSFVSIQKIKYKINYSTKPSQMVSVIFFKCWRENIDLI